MSWIVRDRETGTGIDIFGTLEEAERALKEYENDDMKEGVYTPDFYETRGHVVNECEAYDDIEEYGNSDAPSWYGDLSEAGEIIERLREGTGHRFTVRLD